MAEKKTYKGKIELKADSDRTGEFRAEFATLNIKDHDGDVTVPGAFQEGQETMVEPWNHNYGALPVGKGIIHEEDEKAVMDGQFFLDTQSGSEHYKVVKALGNLQEWSYTFEILKSDKGDFEGEEVQFLKELDVWGVGPVQRGAGIDTRTVSIKGLKPYPNEHACRLRDPGDFQDDSFRRTTREHEGKRYDVIMGRLEGEDSMTEQAYRYPKDGWTADEARAHCKGYDGTFEAAAEDEKQKYTCECLECGHVLVTEEHCADIKCPECGGEMRRQERPGAGKGLKTQGSLSDQIGKIDDAFNVQYLGMSDWESPQHGYVIEMFTDYVIVRAYGMDYPYYRVNYTETGDGEIEFVQMSDWTGGDVIFAQGVKSMGRRKVGARHTAKKVEDIQQLHDLAVGLGAKCSVSGDGEGPKRSSRRRNPKKGILAQRAADDLLLLGLSLDKRK